MTVLSEVRQDFSLTSHMALAIADVALRHFKLGFGRTHPCRLRLLERYGQSVLVPTVKATAMHSVCLMDVQKDDAERFRERAHECRRISGEAHSAEWRISLLALAKDLEDGSRQD